MLVDRSLLCVIAVVTMAAAPPSTPLALQADKELFGGDCNAAIPTYRQAVAAHPDDYVSTSRLASCLMSTGQNEEAIIWEERAANFPSERPNRLFDLAVLYTRLGRRDEAFSYLDAAVDAQGGRFRTASTTLENNAAFKSLHDDPRFEKILAKAYGPGYEPPADRSFTPEKVRKGVELLLSTIETHSPNPYRYYTKSQWQARADAIIARADSLDENSYFWELVSLIGMNGDVHTSIFPLPNSDLISHQVPLRLWRFSDGLYVREAKPELASLVGARILRIGTFDVDQGWDELLKRFPTESPGMSSATLPHFLILPEFARAMGWTQGVDSLPLTLRLKDGKIGTFQVPAPATKDAFSTFGTSTWLDREKGYVDAADRAPTPLWQSNRDRNYWFKYLPDNSAVYFAFNAPQDDPKRDYQEFLASLVQEVERRKAHRLIIDLRNNPGGIGYFSMDLMQAVVRSPSLQKPGSIVVLTSRATQSAGVIIAAHLERDTNAVFMGEPTGDAPNSFNAPEGNHVNWAIPGVRAYFRFSSLIQQKSDELDTRNAIYPDVPIWMSFSDYANGRDPVLERALTMKDSEAQAFLSDPGGRLFPLVFRWRRDTQAPAFPGGKLPRRYF